ncbi:MAG: M20/M25/M40 family metallo-hydrolase [Acidobacteriaceae bacterium]|nr:M20/M25/M40 family metallo-hydrolase [Acidobacteriaceae bacterium]MBV9767655.1 M20/M25/M40 family metallo-hydrolase [Acidobacteriaceae bacterium]
MAHLRNALILALLFAESFSARAQAKQSAEILDLQMYSRIRAEGFQHSHVMEYAAALLDGIGPRLTGSPSMTSASQWAVKHLTAMGCRNAHLESWGEFGLGWTQLSASLSIVSPGSGTFLAQATPWSPPTNGEVIADLIAVRGMQSEDEFTPWKGKLKGKVILYGHAAMSPEVDPDDVPRMEHADAAKLANYGRYPLDESAETPLDYHKVFAGFAFQEKVAKFFAAEGAVAVIVPGGSGGVLHDDSNASLGWFVFKPERRQSIPQEVIETEAWDRLKRLLDQKVAAKVKLRIETRFDDEHAQGFNTVAEIQGTDPNLKDEVVMVGGHLDSWFAGTGATDNGAGVVVAMEAMRILNKLDAKPRRTIRIALWSGEEQGLFGSFGYVTSHYATLHFAETPEDKEVPLPLRDVLRKPTMKPEAEKFDAYYNLDNGTGKILGIYTQGNLGAAEIFSQWMKPLADLGAATVSNQTSGSSDQVAFGRAGLLGFSFIQDERDYMSRTHHTNLDTYEHLSEPDLKQAAVVEAIFLYNTAMRDGMLPRPDLPLNGHDRPLEGLYPGEGPKAQSPK